MSETIISNDELELCYNDITAPSLDDSNYADSLSNVFRKINNNFAVVANHDFIKGATGDSVKIESISFNETNSSINTSYKELAKKCIINKYKTESETGESLPASLSNITDIDDNTITVWDNFDRDIENNTAKLSMIYSIDLADDGVTQVRVPQSSLYYVFLDGRFANNKLSKIDESEFQDIVDASCILVYDGQINDFKILDNAFPTIYYESGYGLCWKINGNASGIPVQGAPGRDGLDTKLFIVKSEDNPSGVSTEGTEGASNTSTSNLYDVKIQSIFNGRDGYSDINSYLTENINELVLGRTYSALIFCPKVNNSQEGDTCLKDKTDTAYNFYFGSIVINTKQSNTETIENSEEDDNNDSEYEVHGYFDTFNSIDITLQYEAVINSFKSINLANTEVGKLPGIFIPIDYEVQDDQLQATQKVHLLSATSISNNPNSGELNTDIIITPVNDINNLSVGGAENKNIKVEKYMYLKLNKDTVEKSLCYGGISKAEFNNYNYDEAVKDKLNTGHTQLSEFKTLLKEFLEKYNYTLKYKLKQNIFNVNEVVFDLINTGSYNPSSSISAAAMHLPITAFNETDICFNTTVSIEDNKKNKEFLTFRRPDNDEDETNKYYLDTKYTKLALPDSFSEKIVEQVDSNNPTPGIYQWVLDFNYDEFDATELVNSEAATGTEKYSYEVKYNNIAACFNSVFTTTMSPNAETEILWFNGITINEIATDPKNEASASQLYKYLVSYRTDNTTTPPTFTDFVYSYKWILYGWDYDCKNLFSFIKYVPIYVNDYSINNDTVFNINYNVNITGDGINKNKALTVHGNVNCEEIHSKSLEATDQIKNIFTKDPTVSENGIVVGYSNSGGKYNAGILENGTIIGDDAILKSVNTKSTKSDTVETGFLKVYSSTNINPSCENLAKGHYEASGSVTEGEIYAINTNKITLLRPKGPETYKSKNSYYSGTGAFSPEGVTFSDNKEIIINSINNTNLKDSITFNTDLGVGSTEYHNDINSIIDSNYWDNTINNTPILKPQDKAIIDAANYQPVLTTTIPINSRNNTPIFVSNVGMDSQQLCANGIAKNYCIRKKVYNNTTKTYEDAYVEYPADDIKTKGSDGVNRSIIWSGNNGVVTERKYVCTPDFDTVKNFNSHRLSINNDSRTITRKDFGTGTAQGESNKFNGTGTNTYLSNNERKILYEDTDRTFTYYDEYKMDENDSNHIINNYLHTIRIQNTKTESAAAADSSPDKEYNKFDDTTDLTIEINKIYNMLIGICGKTSYASNPYLQSGSYISINLACRVDNGSQLVYTKLTDITLDSSIDYTSSAYKLYSEKTYDTGKYVKISSSSVGNYDWNWRYRSYYFKLGKYTISKNSSFFKTVSTLYNEGKLLDFYIYPSKTLFKVNTTSGTWGRQYVFTGLKCTLPALITNTDNLSLSKLVHKNYDVGTYNSQDQPGPKINFKYDNISFTQSDVKSTTITENGIVCRDGDYTFGLGYSYNVVDHSDTTTTTVDGVPTVTGTAKYDTDAVTGEWTAPLIQTGEPVLFYYQYDPSSKMYKSVYHNSANQNKVTISRSEKNSPEDYARRMNFIPLKDIFNTIKYIRQSKTDWAKYGL